MEIGDCYKIGLIMKPHGLKGEVTVSIDAGIPTDLAEIESVFVNHGGQLAPYFIDAISVKGSKAFVKFIVINTLAQAENISKSAIYLPKTTRPKAAKGDFYADEVSGFKVTDETEGDLGTVSEVVESGLQRLLAVEDKAGKEMLIPVNEAFIKSVNRSRKTITVSLPDGFLEI